MRRRVLAILVFLALAMGSGMLLGRAVYADPVVAFTAALDNVVATGGIAAVRPVDDTGDLRVFTTGETTTATLNCGTDAACLGSGLHGAALSTTHDSRVRFTAYGPGAFNISGRLHGTLTLNAFIGTFPGRFEAEIAGTAFCVPVGPNPCGTFFLTVTDNGRWRVPNLRSTGTLEVNVSGIAGVALSGTGSLAAFAK